MLTVHIEFISDYILQRENLLNLFVLIDSRLPAQKIDIDFMEWLGEHGVPFSIIFTKADKLKPKAIENHVEAYKTILLETWEEMPNYFITSSSNDIGKEAVLMYIDQLNANLKID